MHDAAVIYDKVMSDSIPEGGTKLVPICHTEANVHVEVVLNLNGRFRDARMVAKDDAVTILPCTENSATRAGKRPVPHPLVDKLQYLAPDFRDSGGEVTVGFRDDREQPHKDYTETLSTWCESPQAHPKVQAVLEYVTTGKLLSDLKTKLTGVVFDSRGRFLEMFPDKKNYATGAPMDAVVRWVVEVPGDVESKLWKDKSVQASWCAFYATLKHKTGVCYLSGKEDVSLAILHPARLRHGGDKAKLISANDKEGFTFRGRFDAGTEACGVGFELSQKAHSALRWMIARQGRTFGECAFVTWGWSDESLSDPLPFDDTDALMRFLSASPSSECNIVSLKKEKEEAQLRNLSLAEVYAENLTACMAGYRNRLGEDHRKIHLVAIDSASTGCMSLVLDREIESSFLLDNLKHWHLTAAWIQDFGFSGKGKARVRRQFIGAPSPEAIAWLVCGRNSSKKYVSATVNRILPVIIDRAAFPADIVNSCVSRVFHRSGLEPWEWEKALGIACSLYRYTHQERRYKMEMEYDRRTRDYLWGCLLALAEVTEHYSLDRQSQEERPTNAERLFARFAEQPFATWRNIELALQPYLARLAAGDGLARWIGRRFKECTDRIMREGFENAGMPFADNTRLTGEFLMGYHCQRHDLYKGRELNDKKQTTTEIEGNHA